MYVCACVRCVCGVCACVCIRVKNTYRSYAAYENKDLQLHLLHIVAVSFVWMCVVRFRPQIHRLWMAECLREQISEMEKQPLQMRFRYRRGQHLMKPYREEKNNN